MNYNTSFVDKIVDGVQTHVFMSSFYHSPLHRGAIMLPSSGLLLPILVFTLFYVVQHPIWREYRKHFFSVLYVREIILVVKTTWNYFILYLLEIKWWVFKNLFKCGFRRDLFPFSHENSHSDDFVHCFIGA